MLHNIISQYRDFFTEMLAPHKIQFGHVCETPDDWEQRFERKDFKENKHQGKVKIHLKMFITHSSLMPTTVLKYAANICLFNNLFADINAKISSQQCWLLLFALPTLLSFSTLLFVSLYIIVRSHFDTVTSN